MASREFAMFTIESSYGTPKTGPVLGTDYFYLRLHDGDSFTGQMNPVLLDIMYGGGRATPAVQVSDEYRVPFTLKTYLYPGAHSATLLGWCMNVVNSGRTTPWITTDSNNLMPPGDLASIGIYHAVTLNDGTIDRRLYNGCKAHSWTLSCSRSDPRALLTVQGVAIRDNLNAAGASAYPDATEFPAPAETSYPQQPYLFSQSAGFFVLSTSTTARTQYDSVSISVQNAMDPVAFETNYVVLDKFCGRTSTLNANLHMKLSPADLTLLQAKTVTNNSLKLDNGTNTLKVDFLAKNYFKSVARTLPLNQVFKRAISVQNFWDPAGANDLTLTTT